MFQIKKNNLEIRNDKMVEIKNSTVEDYIKSYSLDLQKRLNIIRRISFEVVPLANEKIGYGIPSTFVGKKRLYYACFTNHIGIYPGPQIIQEFESDLIGYHCAKGTIQFQHSQELPQDLIRKIIKAIFD